MIDIRLIRENKEMVKENIKKKFQDSKLPLVDEVEKLDIELRQLKLEGDNLRQERNTISSEIGSLMRDKKLEEANSKKLEVVEINKKLQTIEEKEEKINQEIKSKMMLI